MMKKALAILLAVLCLVQPAVAGGYLFGPSGSFPSPSGRVFSWDYRQNNFAAKGPNQALGTFTNADAANRWYLDPSTGLYKAASADQMRFTADGGLTELNATTLLTGTMPTTFTVAAGWTHSGLNAATPVIANNAADPTGGTGADTIVEDGSNAGHYATTALYAATAGDYVTGTVFASAASRSWVYILIVQHTALNAIVGARGVYFNLATGAVGSTGTSLTPPDAVATLTPVYANGLWRVGLTVKLTDPTTAKVAMRVYIATGDTVASYLGTDGLSAINVYGADLKKVAYFDQPIFDGSASRTTESKFPQFAANAATLLALGAGGSGYVVWVGIPGFSSSVMTAGTDYGLINSADAANNLLYFDNDEFKSNDGANVRTVSGTFTAGTKILVAAKWAAGGNLQVGYSTNGTSMTWGTAGAYDGAFTTTGNTLYFNNVMFGPLTHKKAAIYNRAPNTDRDILRHWN